MFQRSVRRLYFIGLDVGVDVLISVSLNTPLSRHGADVADHTVGDVVDQVLVTLAQIAGSLRFAASRASPTIPLPFAATGDTHQRVDLLAGTPTLVAARAAAIRRYRADQVHSSMSCRARQRLEHRHHHHHADKRQREHPEKQPPEDGVIEAQA